MPVLTPATEEAAMLKPFVLLSAVVLSAFALTPRSALPAGSPPQDKPTPGPHEKARQIYKVDCAMCHGDNGNGKTDLATSMNVTLADWTDPKSLSAVPDKELFDAIRKGKGEKMPPEDASRAKDEEVRALVAYIRGFSKGQPSAPSPAAPAAAPADAAPAPSGAAPATPAPQAPTR
jgi:mono/diheme cytochrome c family protein